MTTHIEVEESPAESNGSAPASALAPTAPLVGTTPIWRRRWFQLAVGFVLLVFLAAVVGNNLVARQYTPDAAVVAYLSALRSGDADAAWADIEVGVATQPVAASLTDQAALRAALKAARPDISSFDLTKTSNLDSSRALVTVAITTSKGSRQAQILVERVGARTFGLYPTWRVMLAPAVLSLTVPKGAGGVSIDGKVIALPSGKSAVAVLPLSHSVVFGSTPLLQATNLKVDGSAGADQVVAYLPQLTAVGQQQADAAVKGFFSDICAKVTSSEPQNSSCPQSTSEYVAYTGQWQVIGDPGQTVTVSTGADGSITLLGFYQMVFAYTEPGLTGTEHVPATGAFSASATLSQSEIQVNSIDRVTSTSGFERPAGATDDAAKALVAKAIATCAGVTAEAVADCPQGAPDLIIENVHWSLSGDPTSGATVRFDAATGLFIVHGNFSMSVSYTVFGSATTGRSRTTAYDAYLVWDGQALQLVTINGLYY